MVKPALPLILGPSMGVGGEQAAGDELVEMLPKLLADEL